MSRVIDGLIRNTKTIALPLAMVVGAIFNKPITKLEVMTDKMLTPVLIFAILLIIFSKVDIRHLRLKMIHLWLLVAQFALSFVLFYTLRHVDIVLAQGAMICALAPIAMSAVVMGGILGANITTMVTYSLLCNISVALFSPYILSLADGGTSSFMQIFKQIALLLIAPFVVAQLLRLISKRLSKWLSSLDNISYYLWLSSAIIIIARTTNYLMGVENENINTELLLVGVAVIICALQFWLGRKIGAKFGDAVAGGQCFGQKNTILAIWMAHTFLNPIAAIAPMTYIIAQNIINTIQMYLHNKQRRA